MAHMKPIVRSLMLREAADPGLNGALGDFGISRWHRRQVLAWLPAAIPR